MLKIMNAMLLVAVTICSSAAADDADGDRLATVLAAQPQEVQDRYRWRHPQETLEFFGIEPGMTVVEVLPGGGWYTKILLPYLGSEGRLIGADYPLEMFPLFGFFTDEQLKAKETWSSTFTAEATAWAGADGAAVSAFALGAAPDEFTGQADAVLLIRALHNLARFESQGGFLTSALQTLFDVLRPGGIVGVVQHQARDDMPDAWANGANGYLKKDFVVAKMQAAGFELIGASDINQNEMDQPSETDVVWRLAPTLATSREDPELRARIQTIGESNRMTLKFRKPE
jgi:predicted methyltransferase